MADKYPGSGQNPIASARKAVAVTASDTVALTDVSVGLLVATTGNYTILLADDATAVTMYLAAGIVHPLRVNRVNATSAASTSGIVAFYGA